MTDFLWTGFSSAACGSMRSSAVTRRNGNGDRASRSTSSSKPDLAEAARSDELAATVNYAEIEERIQALAAGSSFKLIEALAGAVGRLVLEYDAVRRAKVRIGKPGARAACPVGRGRT